MNIFYISKMSKDEILRWSIQSTFWNLINIDKKGYIVCGCQHTNEIFTRLYIFWFLVLISHHIILSN